jgi:excisionase family DNA binding protein
VAGQPLLRLSQLARFWEVNPRTIMTWIRAGRLAAIRSPGNHFRVRVADVRAFCEREGRPVPPFVAPPTRRVVTAGVAARALRLTGLVVDACAGPYDALLAAARDGASLLVLPATAAHFDTTAALAALRRHRPTASLPVLVVGAPTVARAAALERAGATHVLPRACRPDAVVRAVRELLPLE